MASRVLLFPFRFYDSDSWMEMFFDTLFELRAWIEEQCIGSLHRFRAMMVGTLVERPVARCRKLSKLYSTTDVTEVIQHQDS